MSTEAHVPSRGLATDTTRDLPPRFARYIAGLRSNAERPMLPFYPGLRARPWHDPREFPIVADLERLAPEIAAEARGFDPARFQDEAEDIRRTGRWGVLFLLEMGRRNEEHLARCPALRSILERHRTLTTHAGLMYFSCLDPSARVAPHRGPTNVRLRCHLGLDVPAGCGIQVGGVTGDWKEGRCIVFDDSFVQRGLERERPPSTGPRALTCGTRTSATTRSPLLAGLHRCYGAANESSAHKYWTRNDAALRRAQSATRPAKGPETETATRSNHAPEGPRELDARVSAALRAGDLRVAGEFPGGPLRRALSAYALLPRLARYQPRPSSFRPVVPGADPVQAAP